MPIFRQISRNVELQAKSVCLDKELQKTLEENALLKQREQNNRVTLESVRKELEVSKERYECCLVV